MNNNTNIGDFVDEVNYEVSNITKSINNSIKGFATVGKKILINRLDDAVSRQIRNVAIDTVNISKMIPHISDLVDDGKDVQIQLFDVDRKPIAETYDKLFSHLLKT